MIGIPETVEKHLLFIGRKDAGKSKLIKNFLAEEISLIGESRYDINNVIRLQPYGLNVAVDTIDIEDLFSGNNDLKPDAEKKISSSDFIIVVLDGRESLSPTEYITLINLSESETPFLVAVNKIEFGVNDTLLTEIKDLNLIHFEISCGENVGIDALKAKMIRMLP